MNINKNLIEKRFKELKEQGKTEDVFNKEAFGDLKIFINKEPKFPIVTHPFVDGTTAVTIYIGSETM